MVKIDLENPFILSAEEEENQLIAQANIDFDKSGKITDEKVIARDQADFPVVTPDQVIILMLHPTRLLLFQLH
jgi:DNA-directed RNA polymerase subunit beta